MNKPEASSFARIKILTFLAVTALHIVMIMFVAFRVESAVQPEEPIAGVMRLVDLQEYIPPPPPPEIPPEEQQTDTQELIAAIIIETDELPPPVTIPVYIPAREYAAPRQIEYLPMHRIEVPPILPDDQIHLNLVYPPIARRSGIEGIVFIELFIDHLGNINDIRILRENPPNRGFGEAALNAFRGIRATRPAELNGAPAAVRFRYPIRFALR
jgi:protein TonB